MEASYTNDYTTLTLLADKYSAKNDVLPAGFLQSPQCKLDLSFSHHKHPIPMDITSKVLTTSCRDHNWFRRDDLGRCKSPVILLLVIVSPTQYISRGWLTLCHSKSQSYVSGFFALAIHEARKGCDSIKQVTLFNYPCQTARSLSARLVWRSYHPCLHSNIPWPARACPCFCIVWWSRTLGYLTTGLRMIDMAYFLRSETCCLSLLGLSYRSLWLHIMVDNSCHVYFPQPFFNHGWWFVPRCSQSLT